MPEQDEDDTILKEPTGVKRVGDVSEAQYKKMLGNGEHHPKKPNSVFIPLWKNGYLSWQSESNLSVLALIMLVIIIVATLIVLFCSIFFENVDVPTMILTALGQALLAIIGAVLGSSSKS